MVCQTGLSAGSLARVQTPDYRSPPCFSAGCIEVGRGTDELLERARVDLLPFVDVDRAPSTLLADIKASDQAVLDLENMAGLLVEQHVPVEIARGQMNLDVGCSILARRKAGWLRA